DAAVEAVGRLVVIILDIDAVNGDVQGALGEAIDGGIARRCRGVHPGQHGDEVTRIAGDEREVGDLFDLQSGGDVGRLRLHYLAAALNNDRFAGGANFQRQIDGGGDAGVELDISRDRLFEARRRNCDDVSPGAERWHGIDPAAGTGCFELGAGG